MAYFHKGRCGDCAHFNNEAAFVEDMLPGLASLSSAYAAVRSDDGLCERDDTLRNVRAGCAAFTPRAGGETVAILPARTADTPDPWLSLWSF